MIKNECRHAYKLLDHAECLWCEDCVEKLIKRLTQKPDETKVKEFVEEWWKKKEYCDGCSREAFYIMLEEYEEMRNK